MNLEKFKRNLSLNLRLNKLSKLIPRQEWQLFLVAIGFFTRIPIPQHIFTDQTRLNRASRYFALVGLCIGMATSITLTLINFILPSSIAVLISMIVGILLTGAFHEDGLADTADGFGGGWTIENKLKIMKDSRLGSYGAIALILALFLKWQLLTLTANISISITIIALLLGHTLSRVFAASYIFTEQYVRDIDGKSKPLAIEQNSTDLQILTLSGALIIMVSLFWFSLVQIAILLGCLMVTRYLFAMLLKKQIGGYTGDTLGAAQQIHEIIIYMLVLAFTSYLI